jgi:D-3-phosphoglycerate dehydrogenase / 2-oxoglutarate reductase
MSGKTRILIADAVDDKAVALLEADGFEAVYAPAITHTELLAQAGGFEALIVRSRSKVSADVLAAGRSLRVVGRAGAGVDNIDVAEATRRGVVVMNTPGGNTVSTAEHTIAMMLALARNIPAADRSVRAMEWKRAEFTGTEVSGKTLGLVGLGKVGAEVAARAAGLGMAVVAYDPLVSDEAARKLGVEPAPLSELFRRADFISVHTPLTPETADLVDYEAMRSCRRGVRIINCARGGIVNEADLVRALDEGIVAGAALDVFTEEPPRDRALVQHPAVVCTPHLGASTGEAQEKVALQVARQISDFLLGRNLSGAVNGDIVSVAMRAELAPLLALADRMGALMARLGPGAVKSIRLSSKGVTPAGSGQALLAALVRGFISPMLSETVNLVNAITLARDRGMIVAEVPADDAGGYPVELSAEFTTAAGQRTVAGTVFGTDDLRIIRLDGFRLEMKPEGEMLIYTNVDRPGMLAKVSAILAGNDVNIAGLSLGRLRAGEKAMTVISLDAPVSGELLSEIAKIEGISEVHPIRL